jgi:RHS repeat-associated protein
MSARILVSIAGVITDSYSWKAFGEAIQSGSGTVNPYGYIANGLYYTELVDLINAWNNWLKSTIGRWDSRDKLGFDGGSWNPYGYVENNPVGYVDPTGEAPGPLSMGARASDPFPLTGPNATYGQVSACLGAATPCGSKFPETTPETMACVFWHEGNFNPNGNSNPKGSTGPGNMEGMGNLTLPAFQELCRKNCSSVQGFCPTPPKKATSTDYHRFLGAPSTTPCQKAQAAYQYFTLVGLKGYGPSSGKGGYGSNPTLGNSVLDCAACLANPFAYFCLNLLPSPSNGGGMGLWTPFPPGAGPQSCLDLVKVYPWPYPNGYLSAL